MMVDLPYKIAFTPDVLYQELGEEAVLLNVQTESYYILDDVGTRLWQLLSEEGNTEKTIEQMLAEYEVDEITLRRNLADYIIELRQAGLIAE